MKTHSDNINARAGVLAIRGVNMFDFPGLDFRKAFQQALSDLVKNAEAIRVHDEDEWDSGYGLSLASLSVPRLEKVADSTFRLHAGLLAVNGWMVEAPSVFKVTADGFSGDNVCEVTLIDVTVQELTYDTYNGIDLKDIDRNVMKELGVEMTDEEIEEKRNLTEEAGEVTIVKYWSVYAPNFPDAPNGRLIACPVFPDENKEDGKDESFLKMLTEQLKDGYVKTHFDQFFVEFLNTEAPFAYVGTEGMFNEESEQDEEGRWHDGFRKLWDESYHANFKDRDLQSDIATMQQAI